MSRASSGKRASSLVAKTTAPRSKTAISTATAPTMTGGDDSRRVTRSSRRCQHASGAGADETVAVHRDMPVHDHVRDAGRIAVRIGIGGLVLHGGRVEDREVGHGARAHDAAVTQAQA